MNDGSDSRGAPGPFDQSEGAADRTLFDWPGHAGMKHVVLREMRAEVRLRRRRRVAWGLAALLVLGGGAWSFRPLDAPPSVAVAQPVRQALPDGSVVYLRDGSEVQPDFTGRERRVALRKGEALFEVAHDPQRPFVVSAGGVDVRAVGTAFAVRLIAGSLDVLVTAGEVAVEQGRSGPDSGVPPDRRGISDTSVAGETIARVSRGRRVTVQLAAPARRPEVTPVTAEEIGERLAWRVPRLQFSRTPLAEAIATINRFSAVRLVLTDPSLERVPLSGVIRADNIDALLQLLEADYGIRTERRAGSEIVLSKSP